MNKKKETNPYETTEFQNPNAIKKKKTGQMRNRLKAQKNPELYSVEIDGKRIPVLSKKGNPINKNTYRGKRIVRKILKMSNINEHPEKKGGVSIEIKDIPDGEAGAKPQIDKDIKIKPEKDDDITKVNNEKTQVIPMSNEPEIEKEDMTEEEKQEKNAGEHGGLDDDLESGIRRRRRRRFKIVMPKGNKPPQNNHPQINNGLLHLGLSFAALLGSSIISKLQFQDIKEQVKEETGEELSDDYLPAMNSTLKKLHPDSFERDAMGGEIKQEEPRTNPYLRGGNTQPKPEPKTEPTTEPKTEPITTPVLRTTNPEIVEPQGRGLKQILRKSDGIPDLPRAIHREAVKRIFTSKNLDFTKALKLYLQSHGIPHGSTEEIKEDNQDIIEQHRDILRIGSVKKTDSNGVKRENVELNVLVQYASTPQETQKQYGLIIPAPDGFTPKDLQKKPQPQQTPHQTLTKEMKQEQSVGKRIHNYNEKEGQLYKQPSQPFLRQPNKSTMKGVKLRQARNYRTSLPEGHFRF